MTNAHSFHIPAQSKPPFTRDRLTWLSYGMLIYYSYFQTILGPVLPFLRADLHLSYGVAAWHFSAFGCGMIFAGLTVEVLSRRLGRAAIFWGGGGGMSVGGMLIALGHQVWITLVGALAMGSFGTLLLVGLQAALADRHEERQGIALAEANIGASLGAGLSALCVASFVFMEVSWRWTLVVPVTALSALYVAGRREALGHKPQSTGESEALSAPQPFSQPLPTLFWIAWLVVVFVVSTEWCMTFWGASFLQSKLHLDGASSATLLALYMLSTIAGRLIGSRLARVVTGQFLLVLALGITLLGFSFFWLAPVTFLTIGGLLITGIGVSNLWPQAIAQAFATSSRQSDRVSAKISLGAGCAISVAPLLLGTLANTTGLNVAYGIVPCLVITALVMNGFILSWRYILRQSQKEERGSICSVCRKRS